MKIAYIILTCEKYYYSRVQWQNIINRGHNVYYLAHTMDIPNHLYSWGANDSPSGLIFKLIDAFNHLDLDYDWYVIMEDDTFIFHDRLYSLLSNYSSNDNIAIGCDLYANIQNRLFIGAGLVLSHYTYTTLQKYIRHVPNISHLITDLCLPTTLRSWLITQHIRIIHHTGFNKYMYDPKKHFSNDAITFHNVKDWKDYAKLEELL